MKKRVWCAILVSIVLVGFFGIAMATYPDGVLAAIADPWDAINEIFRKIADLERRIGIIERLSGTVPDETKEYPYLATLPPELVGKIEVSYNYFKEYSAEWNETEEKYNPKILDHIRYELQIKNLSNQTIRKFYYDILVKDEAGNVILTLRETPVYTEVRPAGVTSFIQDHVWIKDALEKAGIDPLTDPKLTVEIIIISMKFE
ncbi:MAG: hypothetical protein QMD21_07480 [Candidatus Thermoplasmatota archaeon]|nr:hypothetical protein [Candidatus Thermoplasmatota archaeon]